MLTTLDKLNKDLLDVKYNRIPKGIGLDVADFDEFIRWKRGSFDVVVGHANTGKTTTILYLMTAFSIKKNLKWLVFSSENTSHSVARKIVEFKTGLPLNKLTDSQIEDALKWTDNHFKIMDVSKLYNARMLMKEALEIKKDFAFDGMLIDPYNSLVKDKELLRSVGGHEYDYQIASELRLFCKENDVSVWLNAHAVTEALRRTHPQTHEYAGHITPPSMADVEGGGKWGNRADNVYTIHRMTGHPTEWMISEIHVKKVKETETGGRCTPIDSPIKLRMNNGACGFSFAGLDLLHQEDNNNYLNFIK
jgi:hypothetical protein